MIPYDPVTEGMWSNMGTKTVNAIANVVASILKVIITLIAFIIKTVGRLLVWASGMGKWEVIFSRKPIKKGKLGDLVYDFVKSGSILPAAKLYDITELEMIGNNSNETYDIIRTANDKHTPTTGEIIREVIVNSEVSNLVRAADIKMVIDNMKDAFNQMHKDLIFMERSLEIFADKIKSTKNVRLGEGTYGGNSDTLYADNGKRIDSEILTRIGQHYNLINNASTALTDLGRDMKRTLEAAEYKGTLDGYFAWSRKK